eukprot:Lankesteria_metandrocarpae@DN10559_c0_g1_i1.p1
MPGRVRNEEITEALHEASRKLSIRSYFGQGTMPPLWKKASSNWWPNTRTSETLKSTSMATVNNVNIQEDQGRNNLTREERKALLELTSNSSLVIVNADKNLGVTVTTRIELIRLMDIEMAKTPDSFKLHTLSQAQLQRIRSTHIEWIVERIKQTTWNHKEALIKAIAPIWSKCKTPKLQALPKMHKPTPSVRLVFPQHTHPLAYLHKFLARALDPYVNQLPLVLHHS